ncbi:unnamed protein product, partial [Didymodactylos carnosus]
CLFWERVHIDGVVEHDDMPKGVLDLLQDDEDEVATDTADDNDLQDPKLASKADNK